MSDEELTQWIISVVIVVVLLLLGVFHPVFLAGLVGIILCLVLLVLAVWLVKEVIFGER